MDLRPTSWPPRSLDIAPIDFFWEGYVKDKVYCTLLHDVSTLIASIIKAIDFVTPEMLQYTWREIKNRLNVH